MFLWISLRSSSIACSSGHRWASLSLPIDSTSIIPEKQNVRLCPNDCEHRKLIEIKPICLPKFVQPLIISIQAEPTSHHSAPSIVTSSWPTWLRQQSFRQEQQSTIKHKNQQTRDPLLWIVDHRRIIHWTLIHPSRASVYSLSSTTLKSHRMEHTKKERESVR